MAFVLQQQVHQEIKLLVLVRLVHQAFEKHINAILPKPRVFENVGQVGHNPRRIPDGCRHLSQKESSYAP